jgi:hypothetical protein
VFLFIFNSFLHIKVLAHCKGIGGLVYLKLAFTQEK